MARKPIMLVTMEDIYYKKCNFKKNYASCFDTSREVIEQYFDLRITPEPL